MPKSTLLGQVCLFDISKDFSGLPWSVSNLKIITKICHYHTVVFSFLYMVWKNSQPHCWKMFVVYSSIAGSYPDWTSENWPQSLVPFPWNPKILGSNPTQCYIISWLIHLCHNGDPVLHTTSPLPLLKTLLLDVPPDTSPGAQQGQSRWHLNVGVQAHKNRLCSCGNPVSTTRRGVT